ncbi:hypothetical protein N0V88_004252 [Collariella sp. IMI 366227]|nr:hypothetical protein N0V88_004252 [Collariella sp. IMI 366227]
MLDLPRETPICSNCLSLDIDCISSNARPEWMDGAEKQRQKAEWLKKEVKRKAAHRRERRYLQGLEIRLESLDVSSSLTDDSDCATHNKDLFNAVLPNVSTVSPLTQNGGTQGSTPASGVDGPRSDSSFAASSPDEPPCERALPSLDPGSALSQELEAHLTMLYLDFVFPFLFPFYRPSFADAGRGWILVLLSKNKALFHSALSLAGYFHGIIMGSGHEGGECRVKSVQALHEQQGLALNWLQHEMQDIVTRGVKSNLVDANRVMASIVQLMTSEAAIGFGGNWSMHLDAATELFNEIMHHHATTDSGTVCFMLVLLQLGSQPFTWTPKQHPWGSEQASLRFFTAQLLYFDTIASITLGKAPRLLQWQTPLFRILDEETRKKLPDSEKERTMPHINLQEFIGLPNWVLSSIAETAALDAWKKEMKRAGSLSVAQLVARGAVIEQQLRTSLQAIEDTEGKSNGSASAGGPQQLLQYFAGNFAHQMMHCTTLNTRIWAQTGLTYLGVVLSGWQPSSPEIQASVARTIEMLLSLPSPDCLRTLVWPFTVTGCLAGPEQEQIFRDLIAGMGPLKVFGTIREGFAIMEKVWERRAEIDERPDLWDIAASLNCLSRPALLI